MKFAIAWHRQCLVNRRKHSLQREREIEVLKEHLESDKRDIDFYAQQIVEAERRGMKEFDSERLLHKRGVKP